MDPENQVNGADSDNQVNDMETEDQVNDIDSEDQVISSAETDLAELVRYVATKLVHNPDDISVESELRAGTVYVSLRVPEEEMGRVIGREGRTAKAIRTLVSIAGTRHNVHARLDIDG
jgi:predicted RNA-binding protein YlqC (UPF0109 family)